MKTLFRGIALLLTGLLTVSMLAGCGGDDDIDEPVPVNFFSAIPPGGEIAANTAGNQTDIKITFVTRGKA